MGAAGGAEGETAGAASQRVSSGRQIVTSEQRGHLGEAASGGGMAPAAAWRAAAMRSSIQETSSGVMASRTRCFVAR